MAAAARIVVATTNPGKLGEIFAILRESPIELVALAGLPAVSFPDEGSDYEANAVAKATAAARQLGFPALADDSGLEVAILGGAPGARSARFGGPGLDDRGRVRHLLNILTERGADGQPERRGARFVCVAALATPEGDVTCAHGECEGRILETSRGEGGFGYDPVFQPVGREETLAQLPPEEKNRISHRARALGALPAVF